MSWRAFKKHYDRMKEHQRRIAAAKARMQHGLFDEDILLDSGKRRRKSGTKRDSFDIGEIRVSDMVTIREDDPAVIHYREKVEFGIVEVTETKAGEPVIDIIEGEITVSRLKNFLNVFTQDRTRRK